MNRDELLNLFRTKYPLITLRAYESLLEVVDFLPVPITEEDKRYPIPARDGDNIVLVLAGYKVVIEPDGKSYVYIPFSSNRDHRISLSHCVATYSQSVIAKP
jgi:hypothetical protein